MCPNDCSGRGVCLTQKVLASTHGAIYDTPWDAEKHLGCKCDTGYRGPDCSQKECPSGDDILGGAGAAQGRDCSGRGICDYTLGLCQCSRSDIASLSSFSGPLSIPRRSVIE